MNLYLNRDHDLELVKEGGVTRFKRTKGIDLTKQLCKCKLLTFLGEWKVDKNIGIPWFELILNKNVYINDLEVVISNTLLSVNGVLEIISISLSQNSRKRVLDINFTVSTKYGLIESSIQV